MFRGLTTCQRDADSLSLPRHGVDTVSLPFQKKKIHTNSKQFVPISVRGILKGFTFCVDFFLWFVSCTAAVASAGGGLGGPSAEIGDGAVDVKDGADGV